MPRFNACLHVYNAELHPVLKIILVTVPVSYERKIPVFRQMSLWAINSNCCMHLMQAEGREGKPVSFHNCWVVW